MTAFEASNVDNMWSKIFFGVKGVKGAVLLTQTELFRGQVDIDKNGYIIADETTKTSISGVLQ